jgi:hypothetical protein
MQVWAEYMYQDVWQGGAGGQGTVNVHSQGVILGDVVNF